MLISKSVAEFVVAEDESIHHALEKINLNKMRVLFVVDENGCLVGSMSDGDFRRWILKVEEIDVQLAVKNIMNRKVVYSLIQDTHESINRKFSDAVSVIPLVDASSRLVAVALFDDVEFSIGGFAISEEGSTFIIAEIGNNHQGDFELAKELVDLAIGAGADCVKFQMRNMAAIYKEGDAIDSSADLGAQYTLDLLSKFQLSNEQLTQIFDYVVERGALPLCTPWDSKSLAVLEEYGMPAYKVASADFTNIKFLDELVATGKPLICSTGMTSEAEIIWVCEHLRRKGAQFILLHCNSTYPTPLKDVNLSYMERLKEIGQCLIGYSGHERGGVVPVAAVALGARVVEKHFTIDKGLEGSDHKVSLLPKEFSLMVKQIREIEEALGSGSERHISQGEMLNRETLAKSLVSKRSIEEGELITRDMIDIKSPGQGLQPLYIEDLVGLKANRNIGQGDFFYESDLLDSKIQPRNYCFSRPFGVPVRYHDFYSLSSVSNLDFVEFHLSYQDLLSSLEEYFKEPQGMGFAVHAPELFANDHVLDLASRDAAYREKSILELNRVCDITRSLKKFFPSTLRPVVVVNAGGFSEHGFMEADKANSLYQLVAESLSQVNQSGVELCIQTMPPFPWHFGGQRFHNLFVNPDEIIDFCNAYGYRVCFDISHSMMACNYYKWDMRLFAEKVAPLTGHFHIVDASGVDGEGIEIGKGDVDFASLCVILERCSPNVQFIPEVWQGHKNEGEGFWRALEFLEQYL